MSNLSKEQAYCKMIDVLFAGAVRATPDEINDEVVRIVDTMFVEITKCHNTVKPLAVLFDGLGTMYANAIPAEIKVLIGSETWQDYLKGKLPSIPNEKELQEKFEGWVMGYILSLLFDKETIGKINKYAEIAQVFYDSWIKYSQKDRRLLLCINKARANWRSPLQIALMGL